MNTQTTKRLVTTTAVLLALSLTGCGGGDPEPTTGASESDESEDPTEFEEPTGSEDPTESEDPADPEESEDVPEPAEGSVEAFCAAYNTLFDSLSGFDPQLPEKEQARLAVAALKEWAGRMADVEAPEEMPGDVEDGFEVVVETIEDLDDNATLDDFSNIEKSLSAAERKDGEAFTAWTTDNCPSPVPEVDPSATSTP